MVEMWETAKYLMGSGGPSGFGSKSTAEEVTAACDLSSITAIITGATSGIGEETARVLAKRGARLILPARSMKAAEETKTRIESQFPNSEIVILPLDLSSLSSVRSFVASFLSLNLPLNLLINNAGKFCHGAHKLSEDGVEMTFATNYLGHFLLTNLLLDTMVETARATGIEGRIVNITSIIHNWFSGNTIIDLNLIARNEIPYDPTQAYALSKLANVLHTRELAGRLKKIGANVIVNSLHPGIVRTRLNRDRKNIDLVLIFLGKLFKTIPQAAATTCYVATHPSLAGVSGKYYVDCNEASLSAIASSKREASRLWQASEAMIARVANKET